MISHSGHAKRDPESRDVQAENLWIPDSTLMGSPEVTGLLPRGIRLSFGANRVNQLAESIDTKEGVMQKWRVFAGRYQYCQDLRDVRNACS